MGDSCGTSSDCNNFLTHNFHPPACLFLLVCYHLRGYITITRARFQVFNAHSIILSSMILPFVLISGKISLSRGAGTRCRPFCFPGESDYDLCRGQRRRMGDQYV
ncbi:hypothetical protein CLOSTASPAR_03775 [[Clostridium] asparagiforme DSM 15981]|uniref:Uncharacterized protein n=1 Tax=[Clostridium] asparagiforme DSM 15981 TaxID=518636 RepID=C0D3D5_9FIRM|nr:hypothetical protein CLOSTASPAR_03775 [[Clostridium] asparagiforme DSM 15981]